MTFKLSRPDGNIKMCKVPQRCKIRFPDSISSSRSKFAMLCQVSAVRIQKDPARSVQTQLVLVATRAKLRQLSEQRPLTLMCRKYDILKAWSPRFVRVLLRCWHMLVRGVSGTRKGTPERRRYPSRLREWPGRADTSTTCSTNTNHRSRKSATCASDLVACPV